jgi:hypothetical protein
MSWKLKLSSSKDLGVRLGARSRQIHTQFTFGITVIENRQK